MSLLIASCGEKKDPEKKPEGGETPKSNKELVLTGEKTTGIDLGTIITLKLMKNENGQLTEIKDCSNVTLEVKPDEGYASIVPSDEGLDVVIKRDGKISLVAKLDDKSTDPLEIETNPRHSLNFDDADENGTFELPNHLFKEYVWDYTAYDRELIYRLDKPAMLFFTAAWCSICQESKPTVYELAKKYKDKAYVIVVDEDRNPKVDRALKKAFPYDDVAGTPIYVICYPNGKAPVTKTGYNRVPADLIKFFEENINNLQ